MTPASDSPFLQLAQLTRAEQARYEQLRVTLSVRDALARIESERTPPKEQRP